MDTLNGKGTALRQALTQCPIPIHDDMEFIPVIGAATHKVYNFEVNLDKFILKVIEKDSFTQINRTAIFNGQKTLFKLGIAPEPIWFDSINGLWIERFISAESTESTEQNQIDKQNLYYSLGKVLGKFHSMNIDATEFPYLDLPAQWDRYLAHLPLEARNRWKNNVAQANQDYSDFFDSKRRVLCHNDLSLCHIFNYNTPLLIDWEYAALGSRYFDLVSAIAINNVPRHNYIDVCKGYESTFGESIEEISKGILQVKFCSKVTNGLWYEAKSALPL